MLFYLESVVMIDLFAHSSHAYYIKFFMLTLSLFIAVVQFLVSFTFCGYLTCFRFQEIFGSQGIE